MTLVKLMFFEMLRVRSISHLTYIQLLPHL